MKERKRGRAEKREEVELEISDVGFGGDGVGRVEGRVWFVPFTLPGEKVVARVVTAKKDFVRAELVRVVAAAAERVEPRCEYFGKCGGCSYQHASYDFQLELKKRQVLSLLRRVARVGDGEVTVRDVVPCVPEFGYRNRITVHIQDGVTGFHRPGGKGLVDIKACAIASEEVNRKLAEFRAKRPYDGHRTLRAYAGPSGFRQTNDFMAEKLAETVCGFFDGGGELLVDAYCGGGFFSRRLREKFRRVVGVDWSVAAIAAARENAAENEEYLEADAADGLREVLGAEGGLGGLSVLLDPPAEGLAPEVAEMLAARTCSPLVYVSCNPSTFARDAAKLSARHRLTEIALFDMFAQTAEIELAAFFVPRESGE